MKNSSKPNDAENSIFNLSFSWYGIIGATVVWLLTILLSYVVGPQNMDETVQPRLISPVAQFMLSKANRRNHIEMQAVVDRRNNEMIANGDKTEEILYVTR